MTTKISKFPVSKLPLIPPPLIITIEYISHNQISIKTDRPTNALELGSLCSQIVTQQFAEITKQAVNAQRPDRYKKHEFDGTDTNRGCGICGRRSDDVEIHDQNHATDIVSSPSAEDNNAS